MSIHSLFEYHKDFALSSKIILLTKLLIIKDFLYSKSKKIATKKQKQKVKKQK